MGAGSTVTSPSSPAAAQVWGVHWSDGSSQRVPWWSSSIAHLGFKLDRPDSSAAMLLGRRRKTPERGVGVVPLSCHFGRLRTVGNGGQRSPMDGS